jgi:hypothetical protein
LNEAKVRELENQSIENPAKIGSSKGEGKAIVCPAKDLVAALLADELSKECRVRSIVPHAWI